MNRRILVVAVLGVAIAAMPVWAEYYDLQKALTRALEVSTSVGVSREQLHSERGGVLASYGAWIPNLSMQAWGGHSYAGPSQGLFFDSQGRPIVPAGFDYSSYSLSISSGVTLFDFGANYNRLKQSKNGAEAASFALEYQKDFVTAILIREYYDLVKSRRLSDVQKADVDAQKRSLEQVEAFYRIGSRTKADYLQAQVNHANSELQLLNAQNAENLAEARLKSLLNIAQQEAIDVDESLQISPSEVDFDAETEFMFAHRSDLLAGRKRAAAAREGLSATKKAVYPSVRANFSYGWNDRKFPEHGEIFRQDYNWSTGISLSWNIFDSFQTKAQIQTARANERIAQFNLRQSELDAVLDVKQIVLNLEQATKRLGLAEKTVSQAEENLRLAEERYRVGAGTLLETFQATASLTGAQAQLIEARVDYLVNSADLQRATGRPIITQ